MINRSHHNAPVRSATALLVAVLLLPGVPGCGGGEKEQKIEKRPRPVAVLLLKKTDPSRLERVAGSVASWKTEDLAFEVAGRVRFVIEPSTDIQGRIHDVDGNLLNDGTVLARLDPSRYELNRASIQAQIDMTRKQREAVQIEVDKVIPAQRQAGVAQRDLAQVEVKRNTGLVAKSAGSQRDLDRAMASLDEAEARILQINATQESKRAEVASLDAKILELGATLKEAERDIADCELRSPYKGQVADVHVIPGAYVGRGQRVATVQMMDPIKVDFEVSAATRRRLHYMEMTPIHVPLADGSLSKREAFVYVTDAVADPDTRTFTVTLLTRNEKVKLPLPAELRENVVARTARIWKLLPDFLGIRKGLFIEENAIHEDAEGPFLYKITNRSIGDKGTDDRRLAVEKVRIKPGAARQPFLGIWTFREISIPEGADLDPAKHLVAGAVRFQDGKDAKSWDGDTVILDADRWLLQPGDIVQVDLEGRERPPGFYVPMSSILERSGKNYVFSVDEGGVARRIEVKATDTVRTLRRIEAVGSTPLRDGMSVVGQGALFLVDGEPVRVIREMEVRR